MSGTRVTCEDVDTGDSESAVIENDFILVCDGNLYLASVDKHANGTVVLTIKRRDPTGQRQRRNDGRHR